MSSTFSSTVGMAVQMRVYEVSNAHVVGYLQDRMQDLSVPVTDATATVVSPHIERIVRDAINAIRRTGPAP